ncbi:hypothetical protein BpHYR1_049189 [Brachionus plicatilis]|uniref:Uncharacterized protein n=1 Tax=Brachionus plicatilis TaxID=10195 RepID=A0A3M7S7K0_BRAPC|nr:hypothetical protein BpHYR1_049189 [Brachionus plicatilis]
MPKRKAIKQFNKLISFQSAFKINKLIQLNKNNNMQQKNKPILQNDTFYKLTITYYETITMVKTLILPFHYKVMIRIKNKKWQAKVNQSYDEFKLISFKNLVRPFNLKFDSIFSKSPAKDFEDLEQILPKIESNFVKSGLARENLNCITSVASKELMMVDVRMATFIELLASPRTATGDASVERKLFRFFSAMGINKDNNDSEFKSLNNKSLSINFPYPNSTFSPLSNLARIMSSTSGECKSS